MREVRNELELMIARVQSDADVARTLVADAQSTNNYYREKVAAKFLSFLESEERVLRLYAEAKVSYSALAELMEQRRPYLLELYVESYDAWQKLKSKQGTVSVE